MVDFLTLIGISFYQTLVILIALVSAIIFLFLYRRKHKDMQKLTLFSFLIALLIGFLILLLVYFSPESSRMVIDKDGELVSWTWKNETQALLLMFTNIYLSLVFVTIPFLIFSMIVLLIIKKNNTFKRSFFLKTFFSLMIPIIIGMIIGILLIPLINKIDLKTVSPDSKNVFTFIIAVSKTFIDTGLVFVEIFPLIVLIPFSLIIAFSIKSYFKDDIEREKKMVGIFTSSKEIMMNYLKILSMSLPLIIITRISSIFLYPEIILQLLKFIGVFVFGLVIILIFLNIINLVLFGNIKRYFKYYWSYILIAFIKSNSINYLPETIKISEELGVDKAIAETTSILGLNIGPAICSGYYLMIISLIGLNSVSSITFSNVLILFLLILVVNFTTSGLKGGDEMARNIVLSFLTTTLGINSIFYYGSIFAIESILEPLRHIGNSTSYLTSNLINQRLNKKNKTIN